MNNLITKSISIIFIGFLVLTHSVIAEEKSVFIKPFTLAKIYKNQKLKAVAEKVKKQLSAGGYKIIGTYNPSSEITIFIISNNTLLATAKTTTYGGFGATLRVSLTQKKNDVQVAHNNPTYMAIAYRMKSYLSSTRQKLAKTVGYVKDFGGKGIASNKLGEYHYGFGLERFENFMDLAEHKSHKAALQAVEKGFERQLKDMTKVYRIDIPGKEQTVFGISFKADVIDQKFLNDKFVMKVIDNNELHRSAHLPYELMVMGKRVIIMHPHFRLAVNFPDLRMFGAHSFGQLMELPYIYEEFLIQLAGGVWPIPDDEN